MRNNQKGIVMTESQIFDDWPDRYDRWFETGVGRMVKHYETKLVLAHLDPKPTELILDAGCGTGLFTRDFLAQGASVIGLDISLSMVKHLQRKSGLVPSLCLQGDMIRLPFRDASFDKTVSVTALEFIEDGAGAVAELFRVTRGGGRVVIATLNSLSPWAERRCREAKIKGHPIFEKVFFRSPTELMALTPLPGQYATAVHFSKHDQPENTGRIEEEGNQRHPDTGAFVLASWNKP